MTTVSVLVRPGRLLAGLLGRPSGRHRRGRVSPLAFDLYRRPAR